jgi:ATP-dependent helicase/nuclease subunit A
MTLSETFRSDDERTRTLIQTATDETLFVEAGAGTGKTRALVDRVVALVLAGAPIDRIAAITFTERAAAELRDRVRTGLDAALDEDSSRELIVRAALDSLDRTQISTIHSFCQALLRSYAAEARVDPDFEIQDEVMTQRRREERWRIFLEGLGEDEAGARSVDRILSLGLFPGDLEKLALELSSRADLAEILEATPLMAAEPAWPDIDSMRETLAGAAAWCTEPEDNLLARLDNLRAVVETFLRPNVDRETVLAAGAQAFGSGVSWNVGRMGNWRGQIDEVRRLAQKVAAELNNLLAGARSAALASLLPYVVKFVREDEMVRAREGALTFDDLILRVRELLRRSPKARSSLRRRLDYLLIDEFQDTDPLQVEIALAFAQDPETGAFDPGRLFLVGDPKQSIYRFRRADMAVYAGTQQQIEGHGGRFLDLALSMRSRPVILDWVNHVFQNLIGDGDDPAVQPAYRAIHPNRSDELRGPGVGIVGEELDELARVVRYREAETVAAVCRQAVDVDGWEVAERDGTVRAARFRDIAILMPRRTGLIALERALAGAGIPYRVEGGSLIYRTQEIRDLINCLTAIDDPADEVAVVAALRSPAFACSDVSLAQHKAAGGFFNYRRAALHEDSGPVTEGLRTLARYHECRHDASLALFVETFVGEMGLVETGILDQGDRNSFRRARFVTQQARRFEGVRPESLRAFVQWLERQAASGPGRALDNEGAGVDDDEDSVRILTVHGAKGLEFPIVIFAGLSAAPNKWQYPTFMRDHANQQIAVRAGASGGNREFMLGNYQALKDGAVKHEIAEFDRMLYVGVTRARDHLVVSLFHGARANECAARRLIGAGSLENAMRLDAVASAGGRQVTPFEGIEVEVSPRAQNADSFLAARSALVAAARTTSFTSATAIKAQQATPDDDRPEREDETEPWSRGRARTRVGRAVHAAIQSLSLNASDSDIAAFARAQAVAEAIPHQQAEVERLVRWIIRESPAWNRAAAAPRAMREVPFALEVDSHVVEGFIDLVIETHGGIEVVDWKTDRVTAAEVDERMLDYRLQAGLYILGLESATGRPVTRITYVFATPGIEKTLDDPPGLVQEARAALNLIR